MCFSQWDLKDRRKGAANRANVIHWCQLHNSQTQRLGFHHGYACQNMCIDRASLFSSVLTIHLCTRQQLVYYLGDPTTAVWSQWPISWSMTPMTQQLVYDISDPTTGIWPPWPSDPSSGVWLCSWCMIPVTQRRVQHQLFCVPTDSIIS